MGNTLFKPPTWQKQLSKAAHINDQLLFKKTMSYPEVREALPKIHQWEPRQSPLHMAAVFGHDDMVKELLDAGADVNALSATKATPLHKAVDYGQCEVIKMLIKHGACVCHHATESK